MAKKKFKNPENGLNLLLFEPSSAWSPPRDFPDLSGAKAIGVDLETKDPKLTTHGPGTFRKDGYPVGIALYVPPANKIAMSSVSVVDKGWKGYFPIAHQGGGNLNKKAVIDFAKDTLETTSDKVGSNLIYDAEWLRFLGIDLQGKWQDTQIAEALLDEEARSFGLEALSRKYLGIGKNEEILELAASAYGCDPKKELWKLPASHVGPYAETDPENSYNVLQAQKYLIDQQGLNSVFDLESELSKLVMEMRFLGVKVDVNRAEEESKKWGKEIKQLELELYKEHGFWVNPNSNTHLVQIFDKCKIQYGRTARGNPSFDKLFFKHETHPTAKKISKIRRMVKLKNDFCDKLILDYSVNGRIHATFNQMPRDNDDGEREGARSCRFSCTRPNLQQVPSRDPVMAPIIRGFFVPDLPYWAKLDYSQQEPRIMVHYAYKSKLAGAEKAKLAWEQDASTDYYLLVANEANIARKPGKDLTLGRCYGEGKDKIAQDLGCDLLEAARITEVFDNANPYIKQLSRNVMKVANNRGYIKTILGRHRHFNDFEPANAFQMRNTGASTHPYPYEKARRMYPGMSLVRAYTYKALNALIQGSAADMTKAAMLKVWKELGLVPHLQVHDELNYSISHKLEAYEIQRCMENCIDTLTVPMLAEPSISDRWS